MSDWIELPQLLLMANEHGFRAGRAAGSWVTDGNTTIETYRYLLKGINDGDPMVLDALPHCHLSDHELCEDLEIEEFFDEDEAIEVRDVFFMAFNTGMTEQVTHDCHHHLDQGAAA